MGDSPDHFCWMLKHRKHQESLDNFPVDGFKSFYLRILSVGLKGDGSVWMLVVKIAVLELGGVTQKRSLMP